MLKLYYIIYCLYIINYQTKYYSIFAYEIYTCKYYSASLLLALEVFFLGLFLINL